MKLLVSWIRELGRYVSREFHFVMRDLIEVHGWRHVEPWILMQHSQSPEEKLRELCGEVPSVGTQHGGPCSDLTSSGGSIGISAKVVVEPPRLKLLPHRGDFGCLFRRTEFAQHAVVRS